MPAFYHTRKVPIYRIYISRKSINIIPLSMSELNPPFLIFLRLMTILVFDTIGGDLWRATCVASALCIVFISSISTIDEISLKFHSRISYYVYEEHLPYQNLKTPKPSILVASSSRVSRSEDTDVPIFPSNLLAPFVRIGIDRICYYILYQFCCS